MRAFAQDIVEENRLSFEMVLCIQKRISKLVSQIGLLFAKGGHNIAPKRLDLVVIAVERQPGEDTRF